MNKKISVITPSYLGEYENCASDRENKFIRAVNSFIANTYENKELVIIGDSCDITERLLTENFSKEIEQKQIIYHRFEKKQKLRAKTKAKKKAIVALKEGYNINLMGEGASEAAPANEVQKEGA
jgi:glycosyltransferase involved in cell wall biosynthesis